MAVQPGAPLPGYVLVIEDDRPTRELLAAILAEEGIDYRLSVNGHEAMEQTRDSPPLMVVLDMHLPTIGGEAVATALRIEFGSRLPVLAMSASLEAESAERLGAYGYLQKPFEVDNFVRQVRRGLELAGMAPASAHDRMEAAMRRQREAFERARSRGVIEEPVNGGSNGSALQQA